MAKPSFQSRIGALCPSPGAGEMSGGTVKTSFHSGITQAFQAKLSKLPLIRIRRSTSSRQAKRRIFN